MLYNGEASYEFKAGPKPMTGVERGIHIANAIDDVLIYNHEEPWVSPYDRLEEIDLIEEFVYEVEKRAERGEIVRAKIDLNGRQIGLTIDVLDSHSAGSHHRNPASPGRSEDDLERSYRILAASALLLPKPIRRSVLQTSKDTFNWSISHGEPAPIATIRIVKGMMYTGILATAEGSRTSSPWQITVMHIIWTFIVGVATTIGIIAGAEQLGGVHVGVGVLAITLFCLMMMGLLAVWGASIRRRRRVGRRRS